MEKKDYVFVDDGAFYADGLCDPSAMTLGAADDANDAHILLHNGRVRQEIFYFFSVCLHDIHRHDLGFVDACDFDNCRKNGSALVHGLVHATFDNNFLGLAISVVDDIFHLFPF